MTLQLGWRFKRRPDVTWHTFKSFLKPDVGILGPLLLRIYSLDNVNPNLLNPSRKCPVSDDQRDLTLTYISP